MMSFGQMEARVKLLEDILKQAQSELGECHPWCCGVSATLTNHDPATNSYDISPSGKSCDCWMSRAKIVLAPPPEPPSAGTICKCHHEIEVHAGFGLCCFEGCPCMQFTTPPKKVNR